jgi:hypothetical protein
MTHPILVTGAAGRVGGVGGPHGLFQTNTAHNLVHLLIGVGFTVVALVGSRASVVFMQAFGVIYFLTGVVGFLATGQGGDGHLLGLVHLNTLDNFLHLGLGVVIGAAGWSWHARPHLQPER